MTKQAQILPMDEICQNCRFFVVESAESGFCHRYPPAVVDWYTPVNVSLPVITSMYHFPAVDSRDWCGEFRK